MSVTLVNNSPQLTVATAGTRGLTGAHVVSAAFSGSDLIITLSDGTVVNAGGAILSSSGSNNWVGQQAIDGNVIITGSFILSGSNTLINIGPTSLSGSVNISGSTTITGSLIVSGGTINVIGTNLISASQGVTLANTTGYSTFSSSLSQSISHSVSNLSSSIGSLSGSVAGVIDSKISLVNETNSTFVSKSIFNTFATSSNTRLTSLEGESSDVRVTLNSYTQSQGLANLRYEASQSAALQSASLFNSVSASYVISASSLEGSASAASTRLSIAENRLQGLTISSGALQEFSQSVSAVTNSLQIATASLYNSASALATTASTHQTRLDAIESDSGSWGASTDVSALNTFATSSLASITALQITASVLVAYTTSSDSDINNLELSASSLVISASALRTTASSTMAINNAQGLAINSLNDFSTNVSSVTNSLQITTASLNSFTSSTNILLDSLVNISASLLTSASSMAVSASSLRTSSSTAANRLNSIEFTTESLNTYSSSLKTAIDVADGNLTVIGNLTVQGETTTLNTTNLVVEDKLIELAKGTTTSVDANGAGIYISGADASITWNNSTSKITTNKGISVAGDISVSGLVDGTDILALSSSFHTTSGSYNNVSGAIDTIINGLNAYTSSTNTKVSNLNTISASYLTFTQSYYVNSSSFDDRVTDLEASVGGGGTGIATRVTTLETSASLSAATNSIQSNILTSVTTQIGLLNSTASNLAGGAVGTTNQLNALNASASALSFSSSLLRDSASLVASKNNQQDAQISGLNNFTQSTFTTYTSSVSESINLLSSSINGLNVFDKINQLEIVSSSLLRFENSFNSGSTATGSRIVNLELTASSNRLTVRSLVSASDSYIEFSSSGFPQYTNAVSNSLNEISNSLGNALQNLVSDADLVIYSQSVADTTYNLYTASIYLSQSVWSNTWTPSGSIIAIPGLSRSINLKIQDISGSITTRINGIVVGTGFIERPEFIAVTQSLYVATASLNSFSASVKATGSIINTFTESVNLSTSSLNQFTSSVNNAITINGTDLAVDSGNLSVSGNLYVTGNIVAQQYIVSTSTYYVTESNFEGDHIFGNTYGDTQTINGITTINGALILNVSSSDPISNPSFVSISADIRVVSGTVIAPIFKGTFDGAYSSSIQTNISGTTGFSNFTSSISESINTATSSLSSSVSSSIGLLSASVASINASQVATESLNVITSSLYNTTQSLNNSTQSLNTFSASVIATGSLINTFTSSVNSFSASVIATGSIMNTFTSSVNTSTSSLNSYTSSLKGAMQPNGSNLNVEGDLYVSGNIVAQNYIVSSSVTYLTESFASGSHKFGDSGDDTHQFTGSVTISGSLGIVGGLSAASFTGSVQGTATKATNVVGAGNRILFNNATDTTTTSAQLQWDGSKLAVNGNISFGYASTLQSSNDPTNNISLHDGSFGIMAFRNGGVDKIRINRGTTAQIQLSGSTTIDLTGTPSASFYVKNGATRIDSILFVSDNDYVANAYVGGDIRVGDYLAGGYTAHYDGGVQITGSLRVNAGQNGSGSYFTGSVQITGNEAVSGNLEIVGNTSVTGALYVGVISASSYLSASALQIAGNTKINGFTDLRNGLEVRGNGVNDEARFYVTSLRAEGNVAISGGLEVLDQPSVFKNVKITDLSANRIPYSTDDSGSLQDSANFTYDGVTFNVGAGKFTVDITNGDVATQGTLKVDGATTLHSTLNVTGSVGIASSLTVTGSTTISSSLRVTNTSSFAHLNVTGSTNVTGSVSIGGALAVSGSSRISGNLAVSGTLDISGSATFDSYVNITGGLAVTGGFSVKGEPVLIGDSMTDSIIISGGLEITGSLTRNTTNLKATGSNNPADGIYRLTEAQAWSASFVSASTIRTPDEYLEYFVGQGVNRKRYITPVWLDETLYADDYFDISVVSGADSDYVY